MNELLELLSEEQKKEIAERYKDKICAAIDSYDIRDIKEDVARRMKSNITELIDYVFEDIDLDASNLADMVTNLVTDLFKEKFEVE